MFSLTDSRVIHLINLVVSSTPDELAGGGADRLLLGIVLNFSFRDPNSLVSWLELLGAFLSIGLLFQLLGPFPETCNFTGDVFLGGCIFHGRVHRRCWL